MKAIFSLVLSGLLALSASAGTIRISFNGNRDMQAVVDGRSEAADVRDHAPADGDHDIGTIQAPACPRTAELLDGHRLHRQPEGAEQFDRWRVARLLPGDHVAGLTITPRRPGLRGEPCVAIRYRQITVTASSAHCMASGSMPITRPSASVANLPLD